MSREKELLKNMVILGFGKILPQMASFITLPILTARLTKAEYGTYDLITTLIMLVLPIATLQIQSAAFRFLIDCRKSKDRSAAIITNIFVVTVPISLLVSFAIPFFFRGFSFAIRLLISFYFFFDTAYLTCGQTIRGIGENKKYSAAAIVVSSINMICVYLMVQIADQGLQGVMITLAMANLSGCVYLILASKMYRYIHFSLISLKTIKEMLSYSWPMVPNNMSTWVLKLSDRIVITVFLGIEANAVYAVANKLPNILSLMQSVMVMAWHENASIAVNDEDASSYYSSMLDTTFSLMYGLTVILVAATPFMFGLLIKGNYGEAYYQMPILILAMFFWVMSSYFGGIYIAHKKTANVGISTMIAAAINLVVDLALVNVIGIWAGAISTLAAYMVLYFYRMANLQKFQPMRINLKKQAVQIISMIVMLVFCFKKQTILNEINIGLGILLCTVFNKDSAIACFAEAKKKYKR